MHNKQNSRSSYSTIHSRKEPIKKRPKGFSKLIAVLVVILLIVIGTTYGLSHKTSPATKSQTAINIAKKTSSPQTSPVSSPSASPATNMCSGNTLSQLILVSISQQHLWACTGTTVSYDSAVVTGMELYPADLTPPGTYHIYAKETDQTLTGHDSTGSWSDYVSYWMPFLDNEYGEYGFHDATWRTPAQFGNINIYSPYTDPVHGSHGCVELPLATAAWLYGWDQVGTTVTIEA